MIDGNRHIRHDLLTREILDEAKDTVNRTALLLDEGLPQWADTVDVDDLDLGECQACVAGQLSPLVDLNPYSYFSENVEAIAAAIGVGPDTPGNVGLPAHLGFDNYPRLSRLCNARVDAMIEPEDQSPGEDELNLVYDALQSAWIDAVLARR